MTKIVVNVDTDYLYELKGLYAGRRPSTLEVAQDALTLLTWVFTEAAKGRIILSAEPDGSGLEKLVMPELVAAQLKGISLKSSQPK